MAKFYQHGLPQPYHLSVGAVLFNDEGNICIHHFLTDTVPPRLVSPHESMHEFYLLMRESIEDGETLQEATVRGLQEEFGAEATVEKYLGATLVEVQMPEKSFQKVTLYHAARLRSLGDRTGDDGEEKSDMEWHAPAKVLTLFEHQATVTTRPELHEADIIRRFMRAYDIS